MDISITGMRVPTDEEWDGIWEDCGYATYFHSREWAEIFGCYSNGRIRPAPKLISFSDGVDALLPLCEETVARGLTRRTLSSPAGTFGGWLSNDRLGTDHADLLCHFLTTEFGDIVWRLNPYDPTQSSAQIGRVIEDETHVLALSSDFEAILKRWTKGHSSAARKARKAGVTVRQASELRDFEAYYDLYEDSLRRWGGKASSRYNWPLFREFFQRRSQFIALWLADYEDRPVAGALCLYSKEHVAYWHGAALERFFHIRPVNLLLYEAIKHASEHDFAWFDFNPSGGHEGVRAFKRSFGAESRSCPVVVRRSWRTAIVEAPIRVLGA